jgi:hypothetical protein
MVEAFASDFGVALVATAVGRTDYRRSPSFSISARYRSGSVLLK